MFFHRCCFLFEKLGSGSYQGLDILMLRMNLSSNDVTAFPSHSVFDSQTPAATHVFTIVENACGITSVWKRVCSFPKMEYRNVT